MAGKKMLDTPGSSNALVKVAMVQLLFAVKNMFQMVVLPVVTGEKAVL